MFLVLAPVFVSVGWWNNYAKRGHFNKILTQKLLIFSNLWKLILIIIIATLVITLTCDDEGCKNTSFIFKEPPANLPRTHDSSFIPAKMFGNCGDYFPLLVAICGLFAGLICFVSGFTACSIMTQVMNFSVPLILSSFVSTYVIFKMYDGFLTQSNERGSCSFPFPRRTHEYEFKEERQDFNKAMTQPVLICAIILSFVSILLTTFHVWMPGPGRLKRVDQ